jgi:hypothetical protein
MGGLVMNALRGYTENGRIIPVGNCAIPDGVQVIITVLDDVPERGRASEQQKACEEFRKELSACKPLPEEFFDELVNNRVNITRELDL